jgi:hypothetical protein
MPIRAYCITSLFETLCGKVWSQAIVPCPKREKMLAEILTPRCLCRQRGTGYGGSPRETKAKDV